MNNLAVLHCQPPLTQVQHAASMVEGGYWAEGVKVSVLEAWSISDISLSRY